MDMTAETRVDVPAAQAWAEVGTRFGEAAAWAAPITASSLDRAAAAAGAVRTCHVHGFGAMGDMVVQERLLAFDDITRTLTYDAVEGLPSFVRRATNRWTVEPDGESGCVVRTRATLELAWWMRPAAPIVAGRLRREAAAVLEDLAHHLERGRPHPRKVVSSRISWGAPTVER